MAKGMHITEALDQLGLNTESTEKDVKQAYKDLARIWHPDRFQGDERLGAKTEAKIKEINEAKSVALKYLEKYGHFRFVRPPSSPRQAGSARPKPGPEANYNQAPRAHNEYEVNDPPKEEPKARQKQRTRPKQKARPEPETEAQPEPEPAWEERIYREAEYNRSFSDYIPGQNILISVILVALLGGFFFILFSSYDDAPKSRVEAYLNQREEQKNKAPETRPVPIIEEPPQEEIPLEAEIETAYIDTFFTLGSDKEWVSLVQGAPYEIKAGLWRYGFSTISFEQDKVVGWNSSEMNPLSYGMIPDTNWYDSVGFFYIGSSKADVVGLQGAPNVLDGDLWSYGEAKVKFNADTVISWTNDIKNTLIAEELEVVLDYEAFDEDE